MVAMPILFKTDVRAFDVNGCIKPFDRGYCEFTDMGQSIKGISEAL
jgi:hypothetical protein